MKRMQKGFSLVELMIVVAIIGVLAAVAVPAYTDYVNKSKFSSALTLAQGTKRLVSEYYNTNGAWPSTNSSVGAGADGGADITNDYVASVAVAASGVITATFKAAGGDVPAALGAKKIKLTPTAAAGIIQWKCESSVADTLMPQGCTGGVAL